MSTAAEHQWESAGRKWLGGLGVLVVAGSLLWATGPLGLLAGGLVAVAWYLSPAPYAVAAGHVVVLPFIASVPDLGVLVALESGFLALLVAPSVREIEPLRLLVVTALLSLVLGAVVWLGWRTWQPRWLVGLALVSVVAVGLYGLHRYSVVTLELQGVESWT